MKSSDLRVQRNTEKIVRAAIALFKAQGVKKVSIGDIARKAGVTPATIYNRFASKDGLAREAAVTWYRDALADYKKVLETGDTFEEKLQHLLTFKTDMAGKMHGEFALLLSSDDPYIRNFLESEYMQTATALIYRFFEEGRQQGKINPDLKTESIIRFTELIRKGLNAESESVVDPEYTLNLIKELTPLVLYGILGRAEK